MIYALGEQEPTIADDVFIAGDAVVIGSVTVTAQASLWFATVLRGDNDEIYIGEQSNVQDGSVIHVDKGAPTRIGREVSVGHSTHLHGCTIGDGSLIGSGSVILDFAEIGQDCLVGASSLVTEGKKFPERSLILGSPAKVVRDLTDREVAQLHENAAIYVRKSRRYLADLKLVPVA